jgi:formylglycine-generating enzyme required for sulfatase activity
MKASVTDSTLQKMNGKPSEAGPSGESITEPACVLIPAGWFQMGCETGQDEEKPVHRVWVDAVEMAGVQVRNRDFAVFLQSTGHPAPPHWNDPDLNHPDQPVVAVSWFEAGQYCKWFSRATGRHYRLPSEAEWERAARGDREGLLYPWGDDPPQSWPEYRRRWSGEVTGPLPVGQGSPNSYGLFDVSENVHEWCADWFSRDFYARSAERNPLGPATGERRASRGGSWRHHVKVSRCAARSSIPPTFQYADYGFRLVRQDQ